MAYKIVETRKVITDAPQIQREDLITMTEGADLLKKSVFQIRNLLDVGKLRAVIDDQNTTSRGTYKRYLLRVDIENLKRGLEAN